LRLYPTVAVPLIETELEARDLASSGILKPLGRVSGWGAERNVFGAIVSWKPAGGELCYFTQLFLTREIWGVDARVLNAVLQSELHQEFGGLRRNYIATGYIEEYFARALQNYLAFAKRHLKLPPPLQIEAGLVGIKGYAIAIDDFNVNGSALRDVIQWQGEATYDESPVNILRPFFKRIWANCDVQRPPARDAVLTARLANG